MYICGCNAKYDSECRCDEPEEYEYAEHEEEKKPVTPEVVSS